MDKQKIIEINSKKGTLLFKHIRTNGKITNFFTEPYFPLQVGYIIKKNKSNIHKHKHQKPTEILSSSAEVLIIMKGKLKYFIWDYLDTDHLISKGVANTGDIIIMGEIAHSFKCLTEVKLIEVKLGPFMAKIES